MSHALYNTGQLRFWTEREIALREGFIPRLVFAVREPLVELNRAWSFHRVDGPLLTPQSRISPEYGDSDLWATSGSFGGEGVSLRAETTASSYLYAGYLLAHGTKPPVCVYQAGKSFRRESSEGANAAKLRFFEFYQLEFQCVYGLNTMADYSAPVVESVRREIAAITNAETRVVHSDRLPSYSEETRDIEVNLDASGNGVDWREMASISLRNDYPGMKVLEVAIGLDRLVAVTP